MKTSESIVKISAALCGAQAEFGGALKNATNPHFRSSFSNLESVIEAIKPAFKSHGLAFVQGVDSLMLITRIIHSSGEWIETGYPISCKDLQDPQKVGSSVTYAKRYGLQAAVGIPSVDDDGETVNDRKVEESSPQQKTSQAPAKPAAVLVPNNAKPKFEPPASVKARAAAAPIVQPPLFPKVVEGSSDLGSFIIPFGKHKGKMLSDFRTDIYTLDGYLKWLKESSSKDGKPMSANAAELLEVGEAYLKSCLGGGQEAPPFDAHEELPF